MAIPTLSTSPRPNLFEMRPMTSSPLLSPSSSSSSRLLLRLLLSRRRRSPTPPSPPLRRCLPLLVAAMSSSSAASTRNPGSVVADADGLARKVAAIRAAGPAKLQVIADFDGTLTRYWYDGARGQSSHGLLKQGNEEFDAKREELFEHYHPIEICPDIPLPEKAKLMEEWWEKAHALLIKGGLTYEAIRKSVADAKITFRDGVVELFEFLEERDIPVLVFSAGLADIIEEVFRQKLHKSFKNIKVVSNRMVFNEEGCLVAFKAPVHDSLGDPNGATDDSSLVKKRTNVLLLGDHIGDLGMSDGLNYENRIAVGFLNNNIDTSLKNYSEAFDIVYLIPSDFIPAVCSIPLDRRPPPAPPTHASRPPRPCTQHPNPIRAPFTPLLTSPPALYLYLYPRTAAQSFAVGCYWRERRRRLLLAQPAGTAIRATGPATTAVKDLGAGFGSAGLGRRRRGAWWAASGGVLLLLHKDFAVDAATGSGKTLSIISVASRLSSSRSSPRDGRLLPQPAAAVPYLWPTPIPASLRRPVSYHRTTPIPASAALSGQAPFIIVRDMRHIRLQDCTLKLRLFEAALDYRMVPDPATCLPATCLQALLMHIGLKVAPSYRF
uniref:5'-nucleotidase n=1 Tax=Leersia perrieri TaxID=77586 RepID=A0A0D9VWX7_9ORYZ